MGYFEEVAPGVTLREGVQGEEMEESANSSQEAPERCPLPEPGMSVLVERMLRAWHRAGPGDAAANREAWAPESLQHSRNKFKIYIYIYY